MEQMKLAVIVSGAPSSGKSSLAERLAADLGMPLLAKDSIKETLFDTLGWGDRETSRILGYATIQLLFLFMEAEMRAGRSFVAESTFKPHFDAERVRGLKEKYGYETFQVYCYTDPGTILRRYRERGESGTRHPGHVDDQSYAGVEADLRAGIYHPMQIGGKIYELDTTDFEKVDYEALMEAIDEVISSQ